MPAECGDLIALPIYITRFLPDLPCGQGGPDFKSGNKKRNFGKISIVTRAYLRIDLIVLTVREYAALNGRGWIYCLLAPLLDHPRHRHNQS